METFRTEHDALGDVQVRAQCLWGAQTQRALAHFAISDETMPQAFIRALALTKRAAATVNMELAQLDAQKGHAIIAAVDEILAGQHADAFPLVIWQTGSGTQTNMNMNEVLANRASELLGGGRGALRRVHPNDDVNQSQSSNDVFPGAMHVATVLALQRDLLPAIRELADCLGKKPRHFQTSLKRVGRICRMPRLSPWARKSADGRRCLCISISIYRRHCLIYGNWLWGEQRWAQD